MYANLGCGSCQRDDEHLGIALPAIGGAISAIGSLFGGSDNTGRLRTNADHYAEAVAGDESALNFLKGMSGRFGTVKDNNLCINGCSGWATSVAKDDAYAKYNQALAVLKSKPASTVTPTASGISFTGGPVIAGLSSGPLLLAGAAAVAAIMLSKRGRR
jgi:hypothetical protein